MLTKPTLSVFAMMRNRNSHGSVLGGWILSHMDLAGMAECKRYSPGKYLTVGINNIRFYKPIMDGDLINIYTEIKKIGKTSLTISIKSEVDKLDNKTNYITTEGEYTFVKSNQDNMPVLITKNINDNSAQIVGFGHEQ